MIRFAHNRATRCGDSDRPLKFEVANTLPLVKSD